MFTDEIKLSIKESVLCWLATVDEDGFPNNSPKEIFLSHGSDELLIANIASPNSVKNLIHNPNVCVSFVHIFKQRGFKLKGIAKYHVKGEQKYNDLIGNINSLTGGKFPINGIISIKINSISPILAPSYILYPDITEEQQIENAYRAYGL